MAKWRADGCLEAINSRTKQAMRMSTAILDDYEAHREQLDILRATGGLTAPLLVVHGERDESVPVNEAHQLYSAAPDASIAVIARASHTYNAIHPLIHVPHELSMATMITARFINGYS